MSDLFSSPAYQRAVEAGARAIVNTLGPDGTGTVPEDWTREADAALRAAFDVLLDEAHNVAIWTETHSGYFDPGETLFRIRESE